MPELPEVETVCRGIRPSLEGGYIDQVLVRNPSLRQPIPEYFADELIGECIESVERRAKYIILKTKGKRAIIWHLGMSGRVSVVEASEPEFEKHDHVAFHIKNGPWIVYNDTRRFGLMVMCQKDELENHKLLKDIGPEPLSNSFNGPMLHDKLKGKRVPIKQALLDQRVVAGVGNIYACEALFRTKISPIVEAGSITLTKLEELCRIIRDVLLEAIEAGGSTLKDHAQVDGELGYFQHQFQIYGRVGEVCVNKICKTKIKRITQSARSTFYCPTCQN